MSHGYDVERDIIDHWRCGRRLPDLPPEDDPGFPKMAETYLRIWERRRMLKFCLCMLAVNAVVIDEDTAFTYTRQKVLGAMLECTDRYVRELLTDLEICQDIRMTPCDGLCLRPHGVSKHIYINRPPGARPWTVAGDNAQRSVYRGRTLGKSKKVKKKP